MFLLDTNHCSRLIDDDEAIQTRLQSVGDVIVATSVISQGELIYMARNSERQAHNLARIETFLKGIRIYSIDGETAQLYGEMKAELMRNFGPKERAKRRRTSTTQLGFDDNDLWIAAVAARHGLTVVSSDSDFRRMQPAISVAFEEW